MTDGYRIYLLYCALVAHFTKTNYDFHTCRAQVRNLSRKKYENRLDKAFFIRIGKLFKQSEQVPFLVANMTNNPYKIWVGDMILDFDEAVERFALWKENFSNIRTHFKNQIDYLMEQYDNWSVLLTTNKGDSLDYPELFYLLLRNEISPETYTMLSMVIPFIQGASVNLPEATYSWSTINLKYLKYQSFINVEKSEIIKYIPKKFTK